MATDTVARQPRRLILRRVAAFFIDYIVIIVPYIVVLTAVNLMLASDDLAALVPASAARGQLIGFLTLTVPVTLYFIVLESWRGATLGKRWLRLGVQMTDGTPASLASVTLRNVLKFTPWEIAHTVIWQNFYNDAFPAWGFIAGLVVVYGLLGIYALTMLVTPLRQTLYDKVAHVVVTPT